MEGRAVQAQETQRLACLTMPYRYRLYLEPTFRHWWLALDTVMGSPSPSVRTPT